MNKFYYTYKITLLKGSLAGHYYFGQHRTYNLNDGYAGSGRKIKNYYEKYGKIEHQTYIKEIIAFYNNEDELNQAEKDLIGDKYKTDKLCLNLISGGMEANKSEETKKLISEKLKGHKVSKETRNKISERTKEAMNNSEIRQKISESSKGHEPWNKGKTLPYEVRQKISNSQKGRIPWNKGLQK